jgi:hypothetical protein
MSRATGFMIPLDKCDWQANGDRAKWCSTQPCPDPCMRRGPSSAEQVRALGGHACSRRHRTREVVGASLHNPRNSVEGAPAR